jgi:hypothetical protein
LEHVDEVEKLLVTNTAGEEMDDLEKLIAISHVKRAAEEGVTRARLEEMREGIERDVGKFRELLAVPERRSPAWSARSEALAG